MPLPFFIFMLYLLPNTTDQSLYTTAYEGRRFVDGFTHYLIRLEKVEEDKNYYVIPVVDIDNERYTKFTVSTDSDDGANGSILVPTTDTGRFIYYIYGQNSDTNLDPTDATVVGLLEQGFLNVTSEAEFYDNQGGTPPEFITYGG